MDLVIMAGGMGSRFGGLKQIEPIDEYGNFIIDYSIFDAIRAGFDRVVFIIKEENYGVFNETVGRRVEKHIKVDYAFQDLSDIPDGYDYPGNRVKPWGTAHAIYATRNIVKGNFAIINADDFYGADAFSVVGNFLKNNNNAREYAIVGYHAENTITDNGSVKRGIVVSENGVLKSLHESSIEKRANGELFATYVTGGEPFKIAGEQLVSMNMFGLKPVLFERLNKDIISFLDNNANDIKSEFLIPDVISGQIRDREVQVKVLNTTAVWQGVTYKEDKPRVVSEIKKLVEEGVYPPGLWK